MIYYYKKIKFVIPWQGDLQIVTEGGICYEENQQSVNYNQRDHAAHLRHRSYQHLEQDS